VPAERRPWYARLHPMTADRARVLVTGALLALGCGTSADPAPSLPCDAVAAADRRCCEARNAEAAAWWSYADSYDRHEVFDGEHMVVDTIRSAASAAVHSEREEVRVDPPTPHVTARPLPGSQRVRRRRPHHRELSQAHRAATRARQRRRRACP